MGTALTPKLRIWLCKGSIQDERPPAPKRSEPTLSYNGVEEVNRNDKPRLRTRSGALPHPGGSDIIAAMDRFAGRRLEGRLKMFPSPASASAAWGWWVAFALLTLMMTVPWLVSINIHLSQSLRPFGVEWPWLNGVWILGALPVTGAAVLLTALRHRFPLVPIGLFVLGNIIEIGLKHFLVLPHPLPVPEPRHLAALERTLNLSPGALLAMLGGSTAAANPQVVGSWFTGTFPSGHTFRIAFATGTIFSNRWGWIGTAGGLAVLGVTTTGGHWLADGIGGLLLAVACLASMPRQSV